MLEFSLEKSSVKLRVYLPHERHESASPATLASHTPRRAETAAGPGEASGWHVACSYVCDMGFSASQVRQAFLWGFLAPPFLRLNTAEVHDDLAAKELRVCWNQSRYARPLLILCMRVTLELHTHTHT